MCLGRGWLTMGSCVEDMGCRVDVPCCFLQYVSLPSLHCGQSRQAEIWAPTPTRSPTLTVVTLEPTLTAVPTISDEVLHVSHVIASLPRTAPTMTRDNGPVLVSPSSRRCV